MVRLPTPGADANSWGNILNQFLLESHNADGSLKTGVIRANRLDQMASPTSSVGLNSQKITGLANGTDPSDAATLGQIPIAGTTANTYAAGNDSRITTAESVTNRGVASGYAPLDSTAKLPYTNMSDFRYRYTALLKPWWDKLAIGQGTFLVIGDSITEGAQITNWSQTWPAIVQSKINERFGGSNYTYASACVDGNSVYGGGSTNHNIVATGSPALGQGGFNKGAVSFTGATMSLTFTSNVACTKIGIWYGKQATSGNLSISVDGGAATVIDTGALSTSWGNVWTSGTLSSATHTIKVQAATGGSLNAGYKAFVEGFITDPDVTPNMINTAVTGQSSQGFTQTNNPGWQGGLSNINPDVIFCGLGTNDFFYGSAVFYKSNMTEMLSTIRNSYPNIPIILVKIPVSTGTGANNLTKASAQWAVIDELAAADNKIIVWDWFKLFAQSTGSFMNADKLHPNSLGANALANNFMSWLLPSDTTNFAPVGINGQPDWANTSTTDTFGSLMMAPSGLVTKFDRIKTGTIGTVMTSTSIAGYAAPAWALSGSKIVKALTAASNVYTIDVAATNIATITSPAANFTVTTTGTPFDGQDITLRIKSGATAYTPTWNAVFLSSGSASLPSSLPASKTATLQFTYDAANSKFVLMRLESVGY